jgi:hypothetical protein
MNMNENRTVLDASVGGGEAGPDGVSQPPWPSLPAFAGRPATAPRA